MSSYYQITFGTDLGTKRQIRVPDADTTLDQSEVLSACGLMKNYNIFNAENGIMSTVQKVILVSVEREAIE